MHKSGSSNPAPSVLSQLPPNLELAKDKVHKGSFSFFFFKGCFLFCKEGSIGVSVK